MITSNQSAKNNEDDMVKQFRAQYNGKSTVNGKCAVEIIMFEPGFQRRDLDNQATSVLDALVKAGVIADDSFKKVVKISVELGGIDKENPRAEVKVKIRGENERRRSENRNS